VSQVRRRVAQRPNGDDDPQPCVGAVGVTFLAHPFDHLPRHRRGVVAVLRDLPVSGAVDVEVGDGHAEG
jgi:hypothetical protein